MENVLITGGAGFIGSHLTDYLVEQGYSVTVVDDLVEQVHDGKPSYLNPEVDYIWGNISNKDIMKPLLKDADILSHHASKVGVAQSMYEIAEYVEVNSLATARLLQTIAAEGISLKKVVLASSMSTYGEGAYECPKCGNSRKPSLRPEEKLQNREWEHRCPVCENKLVPRPTPETKSQNCTSVYATTKRSQEELVLSIARAYDIPAVALRYFNVYGSRQSLDNPYTGVCAIFSNRIKNGKPPIIYEDGAQSRDFIHISDVVRANRLAIAHEVEDTVINVGTGTPITIEDVAQTLIDAYGESSSIGTEVTEQYRHGDIRHCFADTTRAESLLDFTPNIGFEEGIEELVEWGESQSAKGEIERAHGELNNQDLVR